MRATVRGAGSFLDRVFPSSCALCGRVGAPLCDHCLHDAAAGLASCCVRCALPLPPPAAVARRCGRCLRRPPAFERTLAVALYAPPFDQLVRALKYGAALAHAPLFAALLGARVAAERAVDPSFDVDVVVPVPLARERLATRGFNQAIEVGRRVARLLERPLDDRSVLRIVETAPQASLTLAARRRNLAGAFAVTDDGAVRLRNRRIGVVDDVMTSGATLDALAITLRRAGVASVVALVVARTP